MVDSNSYVRIRDRIGMLRSSPRSRRTLNQLEGLNYFFEVCPIAAARHAATRRSQIITPDLARAIEDFGTIDSGHDRLDALIIRDAVPQLPNDIVTPRSEDEPVDPRAVAAAVELAGILLLMGLYPFAYSSENAGRTARLVAALSKTGFSSQSFLERFSWHVDNNNRKHWFEGGDSPFAPLPPVLAFLCIQPDPDTPTCVASLRSILMGMPQDLRDILAEPRFDVDPPTSNAGGPGPLKQTPLITRTPDGRWTTRIDLSHSRPSRQDDMRARYAMQVFEERAEAVRVDVRLCRGDVVIFWNDGGVVHRRDRYRPLENGSDRQMVRLYAAPAGWNGCDQPSLRDRWLVD